MQGKISASGLNPGRERSALFDGIEGRKRRGRDRRPTLYAMAIQGFSIRGFLVLSRGKLLKSRSTVQSSRTPC